MALATYDSSRVVIIAGGIPITGYADGTFVTIDEMSVGVQTKVGADGEVGRSMSTDPRVEVTITLMQTSPSNQVLNGLYMADRVTGGGSAFPVLVEDLNGTTGFIASQAWIRRKAKVTYAKEIESREWIIEAIPANLSAFVSGGVAALS